MYQHFLDKPGRQVWPRAGNFLDLPARRAGIVLHFVSIAVDHQQHSQVVERTVSPAIPACCLSTTEIIFFNIYFTARHAKRRQRASLRVPSPLVVRLQIPHRAERHRFQHCREPGQRRGHWRVSRHSVTCFSHVCVTQSKQRPFKQQFTCLPSGSKQRHLSAV